ATTRPGDGAMGGACTARARRTRQRADRGRTRMKRLQLLGLLLVAGCSALPVDGDGVVALEIRTPTPASLRVGEQLILRARALNLKGDSVPSLIRWRTADTALITLDSLSG